MSEENTPIDAENNEAEEATKLNQKVTVETVGACQRHITVEVSVEDVNRVFEEEYSQIAKDAQIHGFRAGHAPRKLVERFYRKEVNQKVKADLLTASISQVNEDEELAPISEPDFKIDSIVLVENAPFIYEYDLEVRPEFDVPQWKGLKLEKPVREFTDKDVDNALENYLARKGTLVPVDEPAKSGDYIVANLSFTYEGAVISSADNETIRIRPTLSFRDTNIENFDQLMVGVKPGDVRTVKVTLSEDAPNPLFRGKEVEGTFTIKEVKRMELPELNQEMLQSLGGFESEAELRDAVLDSLKNQLTYAQNQSKREGITTQLLQDANWDLPAKLLENQTEREMYRKALEMQRAGLNAETIQLVQNQLRQNAKEETAKLLREHFILEKIAEQENIDATEEDIEREIETIAIQMGTSPRRVRLQIENAGQEDALRNQIVENKVLDLISAAAEFVEVPFELPGVQKTSAIDYTAGGDKPEETEEAETEEAPAEEKAE